MAELNRISHRNPFEKVAEILPSYDARQLCHYWRNYLDPELCHYSLDDEEKQFVDNWISLNKRGGIKWNNLRQDLKNQFGLLRSVNMIKNYWYSKQRRRKSGTDLESPTFEDDVAISSGNNTGPSNIPAITIPSTILTTTSNTTTIPNTTPTTTTTPTIFTTTPSTIPATTPSTIPSTIFSTAPSTISTTTFTSTSSTTSTSTLTTIPPITTPIPPITFILNNRLDPTMLLAKPLCDDSIYQKQHRPILFALQSNFKPREHTLPFRI